MMLQANQFKEGKGLAGPVYSIDAYFKTRELCCWRFIAVRNSEGLSARMKHQDSSSTWIISESGPGIAQYMFTWYFFPAQMPNLSKLRPQALAIALNVWGICDLDTKL